MVWKHHEKYYTNLFTILVLVIKQLFRQLLCPATGISLPGWTTTNVPPTTSPSTTFIPTTTTITMPAPPPVDLCKDIQTRCGCLARKGCDFSEANQRCYSKVKCKPAIGKLLLTYNSVKPVLICFQFLDSLQRNESLGNYVFSKKHFLHYRRDYLSRPDASSPSS